MPWKMSSNVGTSDAMWPTQPTEWKGLLKGTALKRIRRRRKWIVIGINATSLIRNQYDYRRTPHRELVEQLWLGYRL